MKIKKLVRKYCKFCKKYTEQNVSQVKGKTPGSAHPLSHGSQKRSKLRQRSVGFGNKGRFSRKAISARKRTGAKGSKRVNVKYTCKECKKSITQAQGPRTKKIEMV